MNEELFRSQTELLRKFKNWLMDDVQPSHISGDMRVYHLDGDRLAVLLQDVRSLIRRIEE